MGVGTVLGEAERFDELKVEYKGVETLLASLALDGNYRHNGDEATTTLLNGPPLSTGPTQSPAVRVSGEPECSPTRTALPDSVNSSPSNRYQLHLGLMRSKSVQCTTLSARIYPAARIARLGPYHARAHDSGSSLPSEISEPAILGGISLLALFAPTRNPPPLGTPWWLSMSQMTSPITHSPRHSRSSRQWAVPNSRRSRPHSVRRSLYTRMRSGSTVACSSASRRST